MEYHVSDTFVKSACKAQRCELFGQLLKRYEVVQAKTYLSEDKKKDLLRDVWREVICENFRDLETKFSCFSKGLEYFKLNLKHPIVSNKS